MVTASLVFRQIDEESRDKGSSLRDRFRSLDFIEQAWNPRSCAEISSVVSSKGMARAEKLIEQMRANPRDWRMGSLETVARRYGIAVRKTGGSHFVFLHPDSEIAVTIPFKRPIKPVYISQFLELIDDIGAAQ